MASLIATRTPRRQATSERGAEILELIIVTPLLLLLIAAMFDFGFLFRNWQVLTNAAREGARIGALPDYVCDNSATDVKERVNDYMAGSGIKGNVTVDADTKPMDTAAGSFDACVVTVELEQPLPSLHFLGVMTGGSFGSIDLHANAVMRTEAQAAK
jgi:Flp pilus assembly protein TadG